MKQLSLSEVGEVDKSHPDIAADLTSLSSPKAIYGFIAANCVNRAEQNRQPFTVLCCDNMQGGGEILKQGVELVLQHHNKEAVAWVCFDQHAVKAGVISNLQSDFCL